MRTGGSSGETYEEVASLDLSLRRPVENELVEWGQGSGREVVR